jgi:VanZ family protein
LIKQTIIPLGWTIIVGVLCGLPGNTFPDLSFWKLLQFDSAAHAFVFTVFTFLWAVALSKQEDFRFLRRNAIWVAGISGILYGILIEIAQYYIFVRRSAEVSDMIADAIGCCIGFIVFRVIYGHVLTLILEKQ